MAGYGEIYVPVDASTVNGGIMTLAGSGEIPGGDEGVVGLMAWITWTYNDDGSGGYTNKGWFWEDSNNDLKLEWATFCPPGYANTEDGFKKWLSEVKPPNLNELLGNWDLERKERFVNENMTVLGVYPSDSTGCIEIHA